MKMLQMFSNHEFLVNFKTVEKNFNRLNLRTADSAQIGVVFDMNCIDQEQDQFFKQYVIIIVFDYCRENFL